MSDRVLANLVTNCCSFSGHWQKNTKGSTHIEPVIRKAFPCHDDDIIKSYLPAIYPKKNLNSVHGAGHLRHARRFWWLQLANLTSVRHARRQPLPRESRHQCKNERKNTIIRDAKHYGGDDTSSFHNYWVYGLLACIELPTSSCLLQMA